MFCRWNGIFISFGTGTNLSPDKNTNSFFCGFAFHHFPEVYTVENRGKQVKPTASKSGIVQEREKSLI